MGWDGVEGMGSDDRAYLSVRPFRTVGVRGGGKGGR
jgi:hypothetical protein